MKMELFFYQGFGSATISGSNIAVIVEGSNLEIHAYGNGTAILNGTGTYHTEKGLEESWSGKAIYYGVS